MGVPEMAKYLEVPTSQYQRRRSEASPTPSMRSSSSSKGPTLSLQEVDLEKEFQVVKTLNEGCFSKMLLVLPKHQKERLVLKAIHCEATSSEEFARELHYTYYLSPHPNVVSSYNVAFLWDNCYVFALEFAPYGDLSRHMKKEGISEERVKVMASQLVSAIEFIHSFHLVHRDVRAENVLVFKKDLSLVKLGDFGHTIATGSSLVKTKTEFTACTCYGPSSPPEVAEIVLQERYYCHTAEDVWSLGILLINCLTGDTPWQTAEITDPSYSQYVDWLKRKSLRVPDALQSFTPRFLRLLKRILEPKPGKRGKVTEIQKYTGDDWVLQGKGAGARRSSSAILVERHESNATSKSGRQRQYGATGKKRSTRSLKLDSELEAPEEPVKDRVGKWIIQIRPDLIV